MGHAAVGCVEGMANVECDAVQKAQEWQEDGGDGGPLALAGWVTCAVQS